MRPNTALAAGVAHLVGPGQLKVLNGFLTFSRPGLYPVRLDPTALKSLCCYGDVSVSAPALELLFRHAIPAAWFSPGGTRCRGRLARTDASSTLSRIRQHRVFANPQHRLDWAKTIVLAKIESMTLAARHYQRHGSREAGTLLARLAALSQSVTLATDHNQLLGLEGAASADWFTFFATLLKQPWTFTQRTRRPPTDPINALLSLGYTWLLTRTTALAEAHGYEIYLGALHDYRAGRPSLACDLIEPFRVPAVDRWVLALCARREINPEHFSQEDNGGYRLLPDHFGRILHAWEAHYTRHRIENDLQQLVNRLTDWLRQHDTDEPQP